MYGCNAVKVVRCFIIGIFAMIAASLSVNGQSLWNVTGRTNQVEIEHQQFGGVAVRVSLAYFQPGFTGSIAFIAAGNCDDVSSKSCAVLLRSADTCTWASLSATTQDVLTGLFGDCGLIGGHPSCFTVTGTLQSGEAYTSRNWICSGGPTQANCNSVTGILSPGLIITSIGQTTNCNL